MKLEDIERLIGLVCEKGLTEFSYTVGEEHLLLKREPLREERPPSLPTALAAVSAPQALPLSTSLKPEGLVTSPMIGVFYRAPAPGARPLVEVGDLVREGQVLCIIEAMKLMNEIEAEMAGKVVSVLVENGQPVEFGEPLFMIEV